MTKNEKAGFAEQGVDVVIHIGAPKTGSSAIQRFCMNNRGALRELGYFYPKHAIDKNGVSGGHSVLADMLRKRRSGLARLYFRYWLFKARLLKSTLLLSSEGFCRAGVTFGPLLEGLDVRVIGWFRHPVEAFVSNYNQSIKRHLRTQTIGQVFEEMDPKKRPANLSGKRLFRWADTVGDENCTFFPYLNPSFGEHEQPIEKSWLTAIGVPPEHFKRFRFDAKRVNRSYVPDALELKRLLNVVLLGDDRIDGNAIDWALQDYSDQADNQHCALGVHLEPEHVERLSETFGPTNRRLAKRFPAMGPLLSKDEMYRRQALEAGVTPVNLTAVLEHLERLCPDEVEQVRSRVEQQLTGSLEVPPEVSQLARWLRLDDS